MSQCGTGYEGERQAHVGVRGHGVRGNDPAALTEVSSDGELCEADCQLEKEGEVGGKDEPS